MFTDIVGYTALMGSDEKLALAIVRKNKDIHQKLLRRFNGQFLKEMGDGILCSFETVTDAVYCAAKLMVGIQGVEDLQIRIGIHLGEVMVDGSEIYGDGVNIASRIEGVAESGQILVSETIYNNIRNRSEIEATFIGEHALKNVTEPIKLYSVDVANVPVGYRPNPSAVNSVSKYVGWMAVIGLVLVTLMLVNIIENDTQSIEGKSIAVLPFVDMSFNQDQEYLGDGIAEELITKLAQIQDLRVIARTSSFQFKGEKIDIRHVGKALNVTHVVEGSVQKSGEKLRVTVQLLEAASNDHIWAKTIDRPFDDIFAIEDEITKTIITEIGGQFDIPQSDNVMDPEAYEYFLKGRHMLSKFYLSKDGPDLDVAEERLIRALEIDSTQSEVWAGLAEVYSWRADPIDANTEYNAEMQKRAFDKWNLYCHKALSIDPQSSYANQVYGWYAQMNIGLDTAHLYYSRAIICDPNNAIALRDLATLQGWLGLFNESDLLSERAMEIDPLNLEVLWEAGMLYRSTGRIARAKSIFNEILLLSSDNFRTLGDLFYLSCLTKDLEEADKYLDQIMALDPSPDQMGFLNQIYMRYYYAAKGQLDSALQVGPADFMVYAILGMWDEYIREIEEVFDSNPLMGFFSVLDYFDEDGNADPEIKKLYKPLFQHPVYSNLIKRVNNRHEELLKQFSVLGMFFLKD